MSDRITLPPKTPYFTWRNPNFRALVYQTLLIFAVLFFSLYILANTFRNLQVRGISSGFSFLGNEAGFGIAETMPIPMLDSGFIYFLLSLVMGLVLLVGFNRWLTRNGKTISEDYRYLLTGMALLFGIPIVTFYLTRDTFEVKVFNESQSYALALMTGIFNTIKVSLIACTLATIIGFLIGIARLSSNWLVNLLAATYIEIIRNIPLLLQIFFWYFAVIQALPNVKNSLRLGENFILNNRGIIIPEPFATSAFHPFVLFLFLSLALIFFWNRYVGIRRDQTGEQLPVLLPSVAILIVLPGLIWLILGSPFRFTQPRLAGFNFQGGMVFTPEFASMLFALSMYHASFIAETVRSGIQAVSKGQKEAASALGLRSGLVMRLVVIPQALRVIIPPLASQYLNITKNSSLGIAIAYMEMVAVGGTILNQSGQAIEVIAIWMLVYAIISLTISMFMNWYNEKMKLVER